MFTSFSLQALSVEIKKILMVLKQHFVLLIKRLFSKIKRLFDFCFWVC